MTPVNGGESGDGILQRARIHLQRGELDEALRLYAHASSLDPTNALACLGMARVQNRLGRPGAARPAIERAIAIRPDEPRFLCELANVEALEGRFEAALETVTRALACDPTSALALSGKIEFLRRLGREDKAFQQCERSIEQGALHAGVIGSFAELAPPRGKVAEACALVDRALEDNQPSVAIRAMLLNRLSLGLEKAGEYDLAFDAAARMNDLRARGADRDDAEDWLQLRLEATDSATLAAMERSAVRSEMPVFIVGMPRSGTSLLEQILDCHPDIVGVGEHGEVAAIVEGLHRAYAPGKPTRETYLNVPRHALDARAKAHLRTLESLGGGAARVTNKMPANGLYLPEIAALFPRARVLRCVRDPRDTCLSCYMTDFTIGHSFTTDLASLARYYALHEQFLDACADGLSIRLQMVTYEHLVHEPERVIREVLEFLGLPWNDACLRHHHSERLVRTASEEQVARPIYSTSVGRWRRYESHLGSLLRSLEDSGVPLPQDT